MKVYIFRHADAYPTGQEGIKTDSERFLTNKGIAQARDSGQALYRLGARPTLVLSSPLIRARQTADLGFEQWPEAVCIELCDDLIWPANLRRLTARLRQQDDDSEIVIVGHQPDLGQLISLLAWGTENISVPVKKAGIAMLSIDEWNYEPPGELRWLLTAKQLRRIAGA